MQTATHRGRTLVLITAVLLLAAALRLVGVTWGAPDPEYSRVADSLGRTSPQVIVHPDAFLFAGRSYVMAATHDPNPRFFENPSFFTNLNFLLHIFSGDYSQYPAVDVNVDQRQIAPFTAYVMGRVVSALMGVLGVAFAFAAGKRLSGWGVGLLAALILAVSFADVQHAHYATTNVTAGAMLTASIWASLKLVMPSAKLRDFVLCGLFVGLAGSTKYNAGLVGVSYALCGLYAVAEARHQWRSYAAGFVAVGAGFFLGTPFALVSPSQFLSDFGYITSQYLAGQGYPETSQALPFHLLYLAWFGLGFTAAGCAVPGIWSLWKVRQSRPGLAAILVCLVVYALVVLRGRRLGDHLLVPIVGSCALLSAAGAVWLYRRLESQRVFSTILAVLSIMPSLAYSLCFVRMLDQPDNRQLAQAWIYAHVPQESHVHLVGPYNVPLDSADYLVTQTFGDDWRPLNEVENAAGATAIVISDAVRFLYDSSDFWLSGQHAEVQNAFEAQVTNGLVKVAEFQRPRWPGDDTMVTTASYYHNPTISIYCTVPTCDQPIFR